MFVSVPAYFTKSMPRETNNWKLLFLMDEVMGPMNFDELWLFFDINEAKKFIRAGKETVKVRLLPERYKSPKHSLSIR